MKRLAFMLLFLGGTTSLPAQDNGIDQDLEVVTYPSGEHVIVWYGHVGRSYFLQVSDPVDHLNKWHWANLIEGGNDDPISHEVGGTGDKGFYRLKYTDQVPGPGETLDTADFDGDGLSNLVEINTYQTDPLNLDSDGDGIPDGWEIAHGLNPNDGSDAASLFPGSNLTNLQAFNAGVQANPNATPTNKDGDGLNDAEDADPNDSEINWPKTPESKYVWIEQVDEVDIKHQPRAVNKHGQILFCDTRAYYGLNTINDPKNLWNSATKQWVTLPLRGSQEIDVLQNLLEWHYDIDGVPAVLPQGQHIFNFNAPAYELIDINDEGTIYGISIGVTDLYIDPLIPGMFWKRTGTSLTQYAAPAYFYPQYPFPASGGQSVVCRDYPGSIGGAIAHDGTINSFASHGSTFNDWMTYNSTAFDSATASTEGMQSVRVLSGTMDGANTFPGAILDNNHALFVETLEGVNASNLWLKDGEDVRTIVSISPPLNYYETDITPAPSKRDDQTERLWIAAGTKVLLEKRTGGTGSARWHQPPSMNEGAIRLNARGEAITRGKPDPTAPVYPKLWRNGTYTDLNEVASKPSSVTITQAIDLASNGIILVQATENDVTKTGILIPVELTATPGKVHLGFDPPNTVENDPADVYWASVVQGKENNILHLRIPVAPESLEWKIKPGDEASVDITPKTFTAETTDLELEGKGNASAAVETTINLVRLGQITPVLLTLKVWVLPQREKQLAIYRLEDPGAPLTQFAEDPVVDLPTDDEIVAACNDCFEQAGVHFTKHPSSGNYFFSYDTRGLTLADGYSSELPLRVSDGKLTEDEKNALMLPTTADVIFPVISTDTGTFRMILIKESGIPYGTEYPEQMVRGFVGTGLFARNLQQKTQISLAAAHESGHVLGLSVADDDGGGGHDQPPFSAPVNQDQPNGLAPVYPGSAPFKYRLDPNHALMQAGTPESDGLPWLYGRWMRHEDWEMANDKAGGIQ